MSTETINVPAGPSAKPLLAALGGQNGPTRPIWMMRQAGRYLPEYREVREQAGSFLNLCMNPELAAEVTLQPIRRFDLDASIIFADILLIPLALGQHLEFREGEGPVLEPIASDAEFRKLSDTNLMDVLDPVFSALRLVAGELPEKVTLIGFCGAPWTVATYMVAGHGTPDQRPAREAAYQDEAWFSAMIDLVARTSVDYLCRQIEAGAEVVQLFDTWAGILPEDQFERWCIKPTRDIVAEVKRRHPDVPIIGFPRGAGQLYARYVTETGIDGVGIDWSVPLDWAKSNLQGSVAVQGNLDPIALATGGSALQNQLRRILEGLAFGNHVFNLGHGILPHTPIEHVEEAIAFVRAWDAERR